MLLEIHFISHMHVVVIVFVHDDYDDDDDNDDDDDDVREVFLHVDWSFTYIRVILKMWGFLKPECLVWADLNDMLYIPPVRRNFFCFSLKKM